MDIETKFLDNLINLLRTIVDRLDTQAVEIDNLKAKISKLESRDNQDV